MKDALGLVEVAGLATAIHVADAMVKSANVTIIDIEKAKGNGWMTVKVRGDVGAVQAAVQAGAAQAEQFGHLIAQKVIPRPAEGLDTWLLASGGNAVLQGLAEETTAVEAKAAKTDMPAKSETVTKLDETKSALLEVFKPGSTESQANTGAKAPSSAAKGSPKKRPSISLRYIQRYNVLKEDLQ
ncbi:BMC domain-containing protein [Veillonella sp. R32]|uniref:BMC domain-containing protein n=1 Tax=Veillonella sp. R32 TaxID=2021312 RepID=UPI00138980F5|nr:BMC domain-containing protein [Veillonella sp. R32]KAF1683132.1 propanediol utilization protein [Veillonella sp. R32]